MRRMFNKDKDVYLLIGPRLVAFRKDCKTKEATATESVSWIYELFLSVVMSIKRSKRLFKDENEYRLFVEECVNKIKETALDDK